MTVCSGFCEVTDEKINVITNASELVKDIDLERAKDSKKRAEKRLKEKKEGLVISRVNDSLARAEARILSYNFFHNQEKS